MDAEAYALNTYMTASRLMAGGTIGVEASLNKIFWSELDVRLHETALDILATRGELAPGAPEAEEGGRWLEALELPFWRSVREGSWSLPL